MHMLSNVAATVSFVRSLTAVAMRLSAQPAPFFVHKAIRSITRVSVSGSATMSFACTAADQPCSAQRPPAACAARPCRPLSPPRPPRPPCSPHAAAAGLLHPVEVLQRLELIRCDLQLRAFLRVLKGGASLSVRVLMGACALAHVWGAWVGAHARAGVLVRWLASGPSPSGWCRAR